MKRNALLTGLTAVALSAPAIRASAQSLTPVRVGSISDDGVTPVLYGVQAGIFRRAGLDIQLQQTTSGAALAAAMVGGSVDIGKSSLMSMISAYARGVTFKLIAGGAISTSAKSATELVVRKDSPIASLANVNGKRIATSALRSFDQMATQALIDKSGGNSSTVQFIELPYPTMLAALEQGRADVVAITNPFLAAALQTGRVRTLGDPYDGIGGRFLIAAWFTTPEYIAKDPTVVQRFADSLRQSAAYTNSHHIETIPILAAYAHYDAAQFAQMPRIDTSTAPIGAAEIQPVIDTAAKYKFIDKAFSARAILPDA